MHVDQNSIGKVARIIVAATRNVIATRSKILLSARTAQPRRCSGEELDQCEQHGDRVVARALLGLVDGRQLTFQASLHGLQLQTGGGADIPISWAAKMTMLQDPW